MCNFHIPHFTKIETYKFGKDGWEFNTEWPKKMYTLLQQFGGFECKIQGHLSYQFCLCINTVVTIIE